MERRKATKTEWVLLALAAVFLGILLTLSRREVKPAALGVSVSTDRLVPQEDVAPPFEPVDLNTATAEELTSLNGIGPALAERILAYRKQNGPFSSVEEVLNVNGIGEKKLEALEGWVTVSTPVPQG